MNVDRRIAALLELQRLPPAAARPLVGLLDLLAEPDAPTSVHDPRQGVDVHIADSLAGLVVPELHSAGQIADLGTGAGLPGLVLAAALPAAQVALVEATSRKCAFLRRATETMGLGNVDVVCARGEEWEEGMGRCDVVTARALASLPVLCEYAAPLLREGGVLVAWKGAVDSKESSDGEQAARMLGLELAPPHMVAPLPGAECRSLWVARKLSPTPPGFPRRAGMAAKRPLPAKKGR